MESPNKNPKKVDISSGLTRMSMPHEKMNWLQSLIWLISPFVRKKTFLKQSQAADKTIDQQYAVAEQTILGLRKEITELTSKHDIEIKKLKKGFQNYLSKRGIYSTKQQTVDLAPVVPQETLIYGDFSQEADFIKKISQFKDRVKQINKAEDNKPSGVGREYIYYSKAQEDVIFCADRALNVIAGAGSGKSSTLILRIIFFHKYLGIDWQYITVCTFTTESRKDFIKKLLLRCRQWGSIHLSDQQADKLVRTFHSLAWEMQKKVANDGLKILFVKDSNSEEVEDDTDNIPNLMEPGAYKTINEIDKKQNSLYKRLYSQSEKFRKGIQKLYLISLKNRIHHKSKSRNYNGNYEVLISTKCLDAWLAEYPQEIQNLLREFPSRRNIIDDIISGIQLQHHLYLPNTNIRVFLSKGWQFFKKNQDKTASKETNYLVTDRTKLIFESASINYVLVENYKDLMSLVAVERYSVNSLEETDTFIPVFDYVCKGDQPSKKITSIYQRFSSLIDFSYSIGVPLREISAEVLQHHMIHGTNDQSETSEGDRLFVALAKEFHHEWIKELERNGYTIFDEVFYKFGNPNNIPNQISLDKLSKVTHFLIDEFQDISPLFITFIQSLKRKKYELEGERKTGSLTTVGDDLQSIYAWRGSAPSFIVNFNESFSLKSPAKEIMLEENYRSSETILRAGECVTALIDEKSDKSYLVCNPNTPPYATACNFYDGKTEVGKGKKNIVDFKLVERLLIQEINLTNPTNDKPLCVLFTSKNNLNHFESANLKTLLRKHKDVLKELTIHSAKGLEADSVIVIGDVWLPEKHHIKETLYSIARIQKKIKGTFYATQQDETLRLTYVAITRAKYRFHWCFKSTDPAKNKAHFLKSFNH